MDLEAGTVFAGYKVLREIGVGGMGSVYLVQHPRLPRQDAMKVIHSHLSSDPVFAARFDREAAIACDLDHPSLVKVYDRGLDEGRLWLTMQFVHGHDAEQVLRMDGPMAPARAVRVIAAIAEALDHAHEAGLVHRDVKPANILLSMRGTGGERAYLADFGIAHASGTTRQLTDTGDLLASLPYAAPEQLLNERITGSVDVYALGCVLYELLTARRLFDQETPPALMGAVLKGPREDAWLAFPPGRPQLEQVVRRAIAQKPADRFPSCTALAEAAREAVAPASVTSVRRQTLEGLRPAEPPPWMPPPGAPTGGSTTEGQWAGGQSTGGQWTGGQSTGNQWTGSQQTAGPPVGPATGSVTSSQQEWPAQQQQWPVQQDRRGETGPVWSGMPPTGGVGGGGSTAQAGGSRPRRRWLWAVAAVLVVAAVTAALLIFLPGGISAPSSVSAEPHANGVEVRWQPVDGAEQYQVHRDGDLIAETSSTTYIDDEVGSGVNVSYTVAAVGADSERSPHSNARTVLSPLHMIGNLAATVDGVSIRLTWAPVTNADRYEVRRDDQVIEPDVDGGSYVDEVPEAGTYAYTVFAYDDAGAQPASASARAEVSPWLNSDELAAAFDQLVPDVPGAGGWDNATCQVEPLNDTATASDVIVCTHPSGIHAEYLQYPDQAALDARIALLDGQSDPDGPGQTPDRGWYRQSAPDSATAWEAWGFPEGERRLMEIYIEWEGHTVDDLDNAWWNEAPWQ